MFEENTVLISENGAMVVAYARGIFGAQQPSDLPNLKRDWEAEKFNGSSDSFTRFLANSGSWILRPIAPNDSPAWTYNVNSNLLEYNNGDGSVLRFELNGHLDPQPPPFQTAESEPVVDMVIADLKTRSERSSKTYGTPLMTHNGREALVDLYQEMLDAVMYLRQLIEEGRVS